MSQSAWIHSEGERIGRFELVAPLGRGGFSEVWRARDASGLPLAPDVALKLLVNADHVAELRREANLLGVVRGDGIVRTLEVGLAEEVPFIALELLEGGDLRRRFAKDAFDPAKALAIVERIIEILARVHSEGVVHGDLKPENVVFAANGDLHIADFGLSRRISQRTATLSVSLSLADARLAGTLDYMAPEQREGDKPTVRSDIYAVGVILHELLLGERPQGLLVPPSERDARIPPLVDRVLATALAPDPRDRFASAAAMLKALRVELWNDSTSLRLARAGLRERDSLAHAWPFLWVLCGLGVLGMGVDQPGFAPAAVGGLLPVVPLWAGLRPLRARFGARIRKIDRQLETLKAWREVDLNEPLPTWSAAGVERRERAANAWIVLGRKARLVVKRIWRWVWLVLRRFYRFVRSRVG